MGNYAAAPDWAESGDEDDDTAAKLGDVLSGRLADVDVDSVEAGESLKGRPRLRL